MNRPGSMLCPVILGRDELLLSMDDMIEEALHGRGRTLFLSGQAGLGKTRLIRATSRKAEAAGLRVDGGSVAPQDHQVPLASIRDMAAGIRGNPTWGTLSEDLLAIQVPSAGDALGTRRVIVRSVADRILEAIDRPTMLVFDDLHWTDELSLEVVGELARHAGKHPLLLLGGYRADEFPTDSIHREWRSRLLSQRHAEEARLRRLTQQETGTAIGLIMGGQLPAAREVVEAVHWRTNGIPLHIEELLAALPEEALSDGAQIRDAHVPDTIGDAVLARLARLPEDARLVAPRRRGHRTVLQPGRTRRRLRPLAARSRAVHPGPRRRGHHLSVRLRRPRLLRFPPPAAPGCHLHRRPAVGATPVPRAGGRVRDEPRGVEHRPRLAALRTRRAACPGLPRLARRGGRSRPDLGPSRGLGALPSRDRQYAGRPAGR